MLNTDTSSSVCFFLFHYPNRLPKQWGSYWAKEYVYSIPFFFLSSSLFSTLAVLWCSLRSNPLFIFIYSMCAVSWGRLFQKVTSLMIRPITVDRSYLLAFGFLSKQVMLSVTQMKFLAMPGPILTKWTGWVRTWDTGNKKVGYFQCQCACISMWCYFPRVRTECCRGLDAPLGIELDSDEGKQDWEEDLGQKEAEQTSGRCDWTNRSNKLMLLVLVICQIIIIPSQHHQQLWHSSMQRIQTQHLE